MRLDGRRALVTGASRGIGQAIAQRLAEAGADVVIVSRKADGLEVAAGILRTAAPDRHVVPLAAHVGRVDAASDLVAQAADRLGGPIDVLVNNAGTNPYFGPFLATSWDAWRKTFEVNLEGPFALCRAVAIAAIEAHRPASIVNVASILGLRAAPLQGAYGMTKAALVSLTRTLAVELAEARIRVNAIAPGVVETRLAAALVHEGPLREHVLHRTPQRRVAAPDEIAGAALYLASDASSFVTGSVITVDGGWTAN